MRIKNSVSSSGSSGLSFISFSVSLTGRTGWPQIATPTIFPDSSSVAFSIVCPSLLKLCARKSELYLATRSANVKDGFRKRSGWMKRVMGSSMNAVEEDLGTSIQIRILCHFGDGDGGFLLGIGTGAGISHGV